MRDHLTHRRAKMPQTFITADEILTLETSFENLIKRAKEICPDCKIAETARENATIDKDDDIVAINTTIKELDQRLKERPLAESDTR
jgi:hypothetical protein